MRKKKSGLMRMKGVWWILRVFVFKMGIRIKVVAFAHGIEGAKID